MRIAALYAFTVKPKCPKTTAKSPSLNPDFSQALVPIAQPLSPEDFWLIGQNNRLFSALVLWKSELVSLTCTFLKSW
jgi:hypothetical protein